MYRKGEQTANVRCNRNLRASHRLRRPAGEKVVETNERQRERQDTPGRPVVGMPEDYVAGLPGMNGA
jgi:hypothetical protein